MSMRRLSSGWLAVELVAKVRRAVSSTRQWWQSVWMVSDRSHFRTQCFCTISYMISLESHPRIHISPLPPFSSIPVPLCSDRCRHSLPLALSESSCHQRCHRGHPSERHRDKRPQPAHLHEPRQCHVLQVVAASMTGTRLGVKGSVQRNDPPIGAHLSPDSVDTKSSMSQFCLTEQCYHRTGQLVGDLLL